MITESVFAESFVAEYGSAGNSKKMAVFYVRKEMTRFSFSPAWMGVAFEAKRFHIVYARTSKKTVSKTDANDKVSREN